LRDTVPLFEDADQVAVVEQSAMSRRGVLFDHLVGANEELDGELFIPCALATKEKPSPE